MFSVMNSSPSLTRNLLYKSELWKFYPSCLISILNSSVDAIFFRQSKCAFKTSANCYNQPKLTPSEVSDILKANEYTHEFSDKESSIKSYDSNQLPSNSPTEDTHSEGKCNLTSGTLFGVFDGHAGAACAQVVSKRLFKYICVGLLPEDLLKQYLLSLEQNEGLIRLIDSYNDKFELISELKELYKGSFRNYVGRLLNSKDTFDMESSLKRAFLGLDEDISNEALKTNQEDVNLKTISVALSGAVTCVAHIDGPHLHIANVGDCQAVLGILTDDNVWIAKKLNNEHNSDNTNELNRIRSEHPPNEKDTVIRLERLLGQLAPLRAFGDVRYKWSVDLLNKFVVPYFGEDTIAPGYYTPPYLTAEPEVAHHHLTPRDKFLILATDGLWDFMTPLQAVQLVGEHMWGKVTLSPFKLPKANMKLKEIHQLLLYRKEGFNMKPVDVNAATHLFRNALGSTEYGVEHSKLSHMLTLPQEVVRLFRDDMTAIVIYFNSDYLRRFHY